MRMPMLLRGYSDTAIWHQIVT